jgi:hypothetical protein
MGHRRPGCEGLKPGFFVGGLRPTVGNTVGIATPLSVYNPIDFTPGQQRIGVVFQGKESRASRLVENFLTTTSLKYEAVQRRARI